MGAILQAFHHFGHPSEKRSSWPRSIDTSPCYGALVAEWGELRRSRLEQATETTTVIPVSDSPLTTLAELRFACRGVGHSLADPAHANDLWIAASALHMGFALVTADRAFNGAPALELAS